MENVQAVSTPRDEAFKGVLFEAICQQYQSLSKLLNTVQMPAPFRHIITEKFDTGFLWVKEAFNCMIIKAPEPLAAVESVKPAESAAVADTVEDIASGE